MKKSFLIILFAVFSSISLFGFSSNNIAAVLPLSNKDKKSQNNWLGVAIAQLLEDDLIAVNKYKLRTINDFQDHKSLFKDDKSLAIKFSTLKKVDLVGAKKFLSSQNIDTLVVGEYLLSKGKLVVELVLYKGKKKYTTKIITPLSDMVTTISYEFYKFLKDIENLDLEMLEKFYSNDPNSLISLQYHSRGLIELYSYMDKLLNVKKGVKHVNTDGKAELQEKLKKMKANGSFNIAAFGQLVQGLENKLKVLSFDMGKILDRQQLYNGAFFFKEAIESDVGYGKNYTQLANMLYHTSKAANYNMPKKSYLKDLCKQAEESRVPSVCKNSVFDYNEKSNGPDQPCYNAKKTFKTFKSLLKNPTKSYNFSASLQFYFQQIESIYMCIDKKEMLATLALAEVAMKKHYKARDQRSYLYNTYQIAYIYEKYEEWELAKRVYLEIKNRLNNHKVVIRKNFTKAQNDMLNLLQKKRKALQNKHNLGQPSSLGYEKENQIKVYQKLATIYSQEGNVLQTKKYLKLLKNYPLKHLDVISISKTYYEIGEYKTALKKAKLVLKSKMKKDNDVGIMGRQDVFIDLYLHMASLYNKSGNYKESLKFTDLASVKIQILTDRLNQSYNEMASKLIRTYNQRLENIQIDSYIKQNDSKKYSKLYAKIADKKAEKLYTQNTIHSMVNSQLNRSLKPILDSIKKDRKTLLSLNEIDDVKLIKKLNQDIFNKQKELRIIERVNNFIDRKNSLEEKNLYKNLPQNSAVLDFFVANDNYYMFILQNKKITLKDLGSRKAIDELIANNEFTKNEKLYNIIFKDTQIDEQKLIIIPTSQLYYLPFEALLSKNGFLIENKTISYLPSVLMLDTKKEKKDINTITFFANPDFEKKVDNSSDILQDRTLRGVSFSSLPGTMLEAKKVQKIAKKANINLKLFAEQDANEKNFEIQSKSDILHIATHGYFVDTATGYSSTGIVLSGANRSIKNGVDRGIISAKKILDYYNFSQTKLVVLSACDTGTGKITSIDGVQSLGNSFMMVGASSVIMNLWEIPDIETAYLMKLFYENLLINKRTTAESIREAKLTMIKRGEPYEKWAALVLFGN